VVGGRRDGTGKNVLTARATLQGFLLLYSLINGKKSFVAGLEPNYEYKPPMQCGRLEVSPIQLKHLQKSCSNLRPNVLRRFIRRMYDLSFKNFTQGEHKQDKEIDSDTAILQKLSMILHRSEQSSARRPIDHPTLMVLKNVPYYSHKLTEAQHNSQSQPSTLFYTGSTSYRQSHTKLRMPNLPT
jgi:hypothetical protein